VVGTRWWGVLRAEFGQASLCNLRRPTGASLLSVGAELPSGRREHRRLVSREEARKELHARALDATVAHGHDVRCNQEGARQNTQEKILQALKGRELPVVQ